MSAPAMSLAPKERLEVLFGEIAELTGKRNAIDARLVEIVAEIDRNELAGVTGARSVEALVAWKAGVSPRNAEIVVAITGTAATLVVTDSDGDPLEQGSLARPPTTSPPAVAPYAGPTGERADWWWYTPFQPPPPSTN